MRTASFLFCAFAFVLQTSFGLAEERLLFGELKAKSRHFRFAIQIECDGSNCTGHLVSLDEGGMEFDLSELTFSPEETFIFKLDQTQAKFEGRFDEANGKFTGTWNQRGASLPLSFSVVESIPDSAPKSVWAGQLNVLFQKLDVQFRELQDGTLLFDSVSQKAGGFVVNDQSDDEEIIWEVPALKASFRGLRQGDDAIDGKWKQGLVAVNLDLSRKEHVVTPAPPKTPNRPQTPQPPFPYRVAEVEFPSREPGVQLAGTLTWPESEGPVAAVVLISGSGPQDRNETIVDHQPFWVLADFLSRKGIAVLRFDDRGVGSSTGDFSIANTLNFASDAHGAVDYLRTRSEIDARRIGLCGHSEGGLIAPLVAAEDSDIAFAILLAGPGVNGREIVVSQSQLLLAAMGTSAEEMAKQKMIQQIFLDLSNTNPAPSREQFTEMAEREVSRLLPTEDHDDIKEMVSAAADQLLSPWFRKFLVHEPGPVLEQVECPILALNGSKDLQVAADLNLDAIRKHLEAGKCQDFELVKLPGLNHLFQACQLGTVGEYAEIDETINEAALSAIESWLRQRGFLK